MTTDQDNTTAGQPDAPPNTDDQRATTSQGLATTSDQADEQPASVQPPTPAPVVVVDCEICDHRLTDGRCPHCGHTPAQQDHL